MQALVLAKTWSVIKERLALCPSNLAPSLSRQSFSDTSFLRSGCLWTDVDVDMKDGMPLLALPSSATCLSLLATLRADKEDDCIRDQVPWLLGSQQPYAKKDTLFGVGFFKRET